MENLIKTRKLKCCDLDLSELSFGCSSLGGLYRAVSDEEAFDVLSTVWDGGIRYFDTAPFYGFGLSEMRTGQFLREKSPSDYVLSTKVGRVLDPVPADQVPDFGFVDPLPNAPRFDFTYDGIMRSYEDSMTRLDGCEIDILFLHDIGERVHGIEGNAKHMADLREGGWRALEELKSTTSVQAVGLGVNEVEICLTALEDLDPDIFLLAGRYTLLDRAAEQELLAACDKKQVDLIIGGVFNSGILATGAVKGAYFDYAPAPPEICKKVDQLQQICEVHNTSLATTALQFPLQNSQIASVLVGTGKVSSMARSFEAYNQSVPAGLWDHCNQISRSAR